MKMCFIVYRPIIGSGFLKPVRIIFVRVCPYTVTVLLLHSEHKFSKASGASPAQTIKKVRYDLQYRIVFSFHVIHFRLPVSMISISSFRKTAICRFGVCHLPPEVEKYPISSCTHEKTKSKNFK